MLSRLRGERVLVTGGAGFIGRHVVCQLLLGGAQVAVMDDFSTGSRAGCDRARGLGLADDAIWECDVRSELATSLIAAWRPTSVVHLAAQTSLPDSTRFPALDADINVVGTTRLLEAAALSSVRRFVLAASCAIYGQVTPEQLPVDEQTPPVPSSPYGISKAASVSYANWFGVHHGISTVALALGNVYGPGQRGGGVINRFIARLERGAAPVVHGDGSQSRDFVYVDDVADAFCRATVSDCRGLVNIGTGIETTVRDVLAQVQQAMGVVALQPSAVDPRPGDIHRLVLSPDTAGSQLGWQPTTPLKSGIVRMLAERHESNALVGGEAVAAPGAVYPR